MIEAWEWCITHKDDAPDYPIMVISTSFGSGRYFSVCDTVSPMMTSAAENAAAAGITLFSSSGNDGYCNSTGWPACISSVISVGAVYDAAIGFRGFCIDPDSCNGYSDSTACPSPQNNEWRCDDTSPSADDVTCYSNSASFLDLFASSNSTYTTDIAGAGGYSSDDYTSNFGGTSAACPYAAGAAASLQNAAKELAGSFLTPGEVRSTLIGTGNPITDSKIDITKPRVNLGSAIEFVRESTNYKSRDFNGDSYSRSVVASRQQRSECHLADGWHCI